MNRRRILLLCATLVLIGGASAAWFLLAPQDAEFVIVGPKTQGVRGQWIALDQMIDPADFRDCRTVSNVLNLLSNRIAGDRADLFIFIEQESFAEEAGNVLDLYHAPVSYPATAQPMTVKQFLRLTMSQTGARDVAYVLRSHSITMTTKTAARQERLEYLSRLSAFDRVVTFWKECTGDLDPDPPLMIK